MTQKIPDSFSTYKFSDRESLEGWILTELQKQIIQTEISTIAQQLLNLDLNPEHPLLYLKDKMYLQGQMTAYQYLLDRSAASEDVVRQLALSSSSSAQ